MEHYDFYVEDLKVGDAPQTQLAYYATLFPTNGLFLQAVGKTFDQHFADFSPFDRDDPNDPKQSWQAPGYTVFDLHAGYDLPLRNSPVEIWLFANVFNVFDTEYIQDAVDNSRYNSFDDDNDADDAEVFFGLPRTFTLGTQITY